MKLLDEATVAVLGGRFGFRRVVDGSHIPALSGQLIWFARDVRRSL